MGAAALAGGLRQVEIGARTFGYFLASEVNPVVCAGFLPDISQGFRTFVSALRVVEDTRGAAPAQADPFDSHPPMAERLAAIGATDAIRVDGERAISLLDRVPELEFEVFRVKQASQTRLLPIAWEDVPERVYLPACRSVVSANVELLRQLSMDRLPTSVVETLPFARYLKDPKEGYVAGDAIAGRFVNVVGAAFCVLLADQGWTIRTGPGQTVCFVRGEGHVEPLARISGIVFGKESRAEWLETLRNTGVPTGSFQPIE
jgi:hypothetical protein